MATRAMARRRTTNDALSRFTKRGPSARGITRGVAAAATTCLLYYYTAPHDAHAGQATHARRGRYWMRCTAQPPRTGS